MYLMAGIPEYLLMLEELWWPASKTLKVGYHVFFNKAGSWQSGSQQDRLSGVVVFRSGNLVRINVDE